MTEGRHDPDQELIAQGIANLAAPLVGGLPATGAIARTATNIQSGGTTPIAGMVHAGVVLVFITLLVPLAAVIPLAVLAGILVVVAYNMSDVHQFRRLGRMPRADAVVLLTTFLITVLVDLVTAVEVGIVLAAILFMVRMSHVGRFEVVDPGADPIAGTQQSLEGKAIPPGTLVYSIDGPFFFGAAERFQRTFRNIQEVPRVVILRMRHVPYMDATGLAALTTLTKVLLKKGATVVVSAVQEQPFDLMRRNGYLDLIGAGNAVPHIDAALERARQITAA
jgi:sulfate permease, SulP family